MNDRLRILVLTDHDQHSAENSLYALVSQMLLHPACEHVDLASRAVIENKGFFNHNTDNQPWVSRAKKGFRFGQEKLFTENLRKSSLQAYNLILLRLPRPVSDDFLLWLERKAEDVKIVNRPSGIIETSNKKFLLNFPALCPPMKLCKSTKELYKEVSKYPLVIKPLREYGGKGIVKIVGEQVDDGDQQIPLTIYLNQIKEQISTEGVLAMKYLPKVHRGDKRILVVGGEIMAASLRLPKKGKWLCNVSQGGQSKATEVTPEEQNIVKRIHPHLQKHGIFIYGIDTLENDDDKRVLSEINTLSVGGFPQAEQQSGRPIIKATIDKIYKYVVNREL